MIGICLLIFFNYYHLDDEVRVYEGDTVKFNCPAGLHQLTGHGVEWYHNDVKIDPRQHERIRYMKKK